MKKFNKTPKGELPEFAKNQPEHIVNIVRIIKNNAEIRRYTSLGIIQYLHEQGHLTGEKNYVTFNWKNFVVYSDGWVRSYPYKNVFFINSFVESFSKFANEAQMKIDTFLDIEMPNRDNSENHTSPVKEDETQNEDTTTTNVESNSETKDDTK